MYCQYPAKETTRSIRKNLGNINLIKAFMQCTLKNPEQKTCFRISNKGCEFHGERKEHLKQKKRNIAVNSSISIFYVMQLIF